MQSLHKGAINALAAPGLTKLLAYFDADCLLILFGQSAVFDKEQHHVGANFLGSKRRNADRDLNQFVEVTSDQILIDARKVLPDSVLNHRIISRNHERGVLKKKKEPDCFQRRNSRRGKAP